jgi:hypothetical protein
MHLFIRQSLASATEQETAAHAPWHVQLIALWCVTIDANVSYVYNNENYNTSDDGGLVTMFFSHPNNESHSPTCKTMMQT